MIIWPNNGASEPARGAIEVAPRAVLEYAAWGRPPAEAPTIVLLHEGLGCIALWRDFPAKLAEVTGCGVFTYSRLGYGHSSPIVPPLPVTRMADEAREVLPVLLDAVSPQWLILVGHSDGGTVAAHYLAGETHLALRAAVLMSAHFFCEPSNIAAIRDTTAAFEQGDLRRRLAKYHDDVDGAFYGWAHTWLDPDFAGWDMRGELQRWRRPVLFMQGRDDRYGSEAQAAAADAAPDTQVMWVDDCAHSPHLEQGPGTLRLIADFVAGVMRDAG